MANTPERPLPGVTFVNPIETGVGADGDSFVIAETTTVSFDPSVPPEKIAEEHRRAFAEHMGTPVENVDSGNLPPTFGLNTSFGSRHPKASHWQPRGMWGENAPGSKKPNLN